MGLGLIVDRSLNIHVLYSALLKQTVALSESP